MSQESVVDVGSPPPEENMDEAPPSPPPPPINPPKSWRKKIMAFLRQNLQTILVICGVVFGIIFGFVLRYVRTWTKREIMYVSLFGQLFLNTLKAVTLPLIVSSIITAVGSLDIRLMSRIGGRAMGYYLMSTAIAVFTGICLSLAIQPGNYASKDKPHEEAKPSLTEDIIFDMFRQLFPPNIIQAALQSYQTKIKHPNATAKPTASNNGMSETTTTPGENTTLSYRLYDIGSEFRDGINIIGLIVFSVTLGVALANLGQMGKIVLRVTEAITEAMLRITNWIIWISPAGIFFLLAGEILSIDNLGEAGQALGLYVATSMTGFAIHSFIILPLLYFVFVRKLPFKYIANSMPALVMALSTSSSLATLPVTLKTLEESNKIDKRVTRFVLPIGATVNMDGMALYEAVAVIFVYQASGLPIDPGKVVVLSLIATIASIGASGVPNAGVIMTLIVLNSVGIPTDYIKYIVATDWILDRFSTAVNVFGDCIATGVVGKWCLKDLIKFDEEMEAAGNPPPVQPSNVDSRTLHEPFSSQSVDGGHTSVEGGMQQPMGNPGSHP